MPVRGSVIWSFRPKSPSCWNCSQLARYDGLARLRLCRNCASDIGRTDPSPNRTVGFFRSGPPSATATIGLGDVSMRSVPKITTGWPVRVLIFEIRPSTSKVLSANPISLSRLTPAIRSAWALFCWRNRTVTVSRAHAATSATATALTTRDPVHGPKRLQIETRFAGSSLSWLPVSAKPSTSALT